MKLLHWISNNRIAKKSQKWRKIAGCRWIPQTANKIRRPIFVFIDNEIYPLVWQKDIKYEIINDNTSSMHGTY